MMDSPLVRGIQTTEWWGTVAMHVFTLLTLFGAIHLSGTQQDDLVKSVSILGSAIVQGIYTLNRMRLKTQPTIGAAIQDVPSDTPAT